MRFYMATLLSVSLALVACNAPSVVISPTKKFISIPEVGVEMTANLGDFLLRQGYYMTSDGIEVTELSRAKLDGSFKCFLIHPGKYARVGLGDDLDYFSIVEGIGKVSYEGSICSAQNPPKFLAVNRRSGKLAVIDGIGQFVQADSSPFIRTEVVVASESDFQRVLIYNGKRGENIQVGYREFSRNLARPAFSNEISYDLSESSLVGYKEARIRIIEATNSTITYVVEKGFEELSL